MAESDNVASKEDKGFYKEFNAIEHTARRRLSSLPVAKVFMSYIFFPAKIVNYKVVAIQRQNCYKVSNFWDLLIHLQYNYFPNCLCSKSSQIS